MVVTRPKADAPAWLDGLAQAGFGTVALPLIDILPLADQHALEQARSRQASYHALMFVSGNAVGHFYEVKVPIVPVNSAWIAIKTRAYATGPGTVAALRQAGFPADRIDAPAPDAAQFDSEALWALVQPQIKPGWRVLIVRGAGAATGASTGASNGTLTDALFKPDGRDWLARQLCTAGAQVDVVAAYQRAMPRFTPAQKADAQQHATDGSVWLFSSSEALANLAAWLPGQDWSAARAVATHSRIAATAKSLGFGVVCESRPTLPSVVASIESMG